MDLREGHAHQIAPAELADALVLLAHGHELAQLVEWGERLASADPGVEALADYREIVEESVAKLAGDLAQGFAVAFEGRQGDRRGEGEGREIGVNLATEPIDDLIGIASSQRQGSPRGLITQLRIAEQAVPGSA